MKTQNRSKSLYFGTDFHCLGDPKSFKIIENRLKSLFGASWGQALRQPLRQPLRQSLRQPRVKACAVRPRLPRAHTYAQLNMSHVAAEQMLNQV